MERLKLINSINIEIDNFDFRNTLVIGNNDEGKLSIFKRFIQKGYDCYVISNTPKNYSEIIASNRVFYPKDASAIFQLLDAVMEKRYNNLATHNFKKIKDDIDNSSLADKSIIIIDSIDSLSPFAREIERYFIPILQKGYTARICFVICVDRIINSYFMQAIVANCPNKIELQDAAVSLPTDDKEYYSFIEAVILIVKRGQASISLLQRRMSISYNRAKSYIDKMVGLGLVAYVEGDLRPKVMVASEDEALEIIHKYENK